MRLQRERVGVVRVLGENGVGLFARLDGLPMFEKLRGILVPLGTGRVSEGKSDWLCRPSTPM